MLPYETTAAFDLGPRFDAANLTDAIDDAIRASGVVEGIVSAFSVGSTGAVTTIEFEPGCLDDLF